jgi:hypothetical protein
MVEKLPHHRSGIPVEFEDVLEHLLVIPQTKHSSEITQSSVFVHYCGLLT